MGIKLSFEITSPLGPDDKELLTGLSIMTLAIANHELAKEHFPGVFDGLEDDGDVQTTPDQDGPEPLPCRATNERDESCSSEVGHRGRHRFRAVGIDMRPRPTEAVN
jgi:hypothetical protein